MGSIDCKSYETKLVEMLNEKLKKNSEAFNGAGVIYDEPRVEVCDSSESTYTSEIRTYIRRGQNILDAIEFFAIQNGKPVAPLDEMSEWLDETIDSVVQDLDS